MAEEVTKKFVKDEDNQPEFIEGFALSGVEVKATKEKDFEVLEVPIYEAYQDDKEVKRRMKMYIKFNGSEVAYYPNKTSQAKIIAQKGRRLEDWVGFRGEFETLAQKIGQETKEVIYIK